MRATIAIDDQLLSEAFKLTGVKTKKELVDISLRELIRKKRLEQLAGMYGSQAVTISQEELEEYRAGDE